MLNSLILHNKKNHYFNNNSDLTIESYNYLNNYLNFIIYNLSQEYNEFIENIDKPLIATGGYVARYNTRLLLKDYNILDYILKLIEKYSISENYNLEYLKKNQRDLLLLLSILDNDDLYIILNFLNNKIKQIGDDRILLLNELKKYISNIIFVDIDLKLYIGIDKDLTIPQNMFKKNFQKFSNIQYLNYYTDDFIKLSNTINIFFKNEINFINQSSIEDLSENIEIIIKPENFEAIRIYNNSDLYISNEILDGLDGTIKDVRKNHINQQIYDILNFNRFDFVKFYSEFCSIILTNLCTLFHKFKPQDNFTYIPINSEMDSLRESKCSATRDFIFNKNNTNINIRVIIVMDITLLDIFELPNLICRISKKIPYNWVEIMEIDKTPIYYHQTNTDLNIYSGNPESNNKYIILSENLKCDSIFMSLKNELSKVSNNNLGKPGQMFNDDLREIKTKFNIERLLITILSQIDNKNDVNNGLILYKLLSKIGLVDFLLTYGLNSNEIKRYFISIEKDYENDNENISKLLALIKSRYLDESNLLIKHNLNKNNININQFNLFINQLLEKNKDLLLLSKNHKRNNISENDNYYSIIKNYENTSYFKNLINILFNSELLQKIYVEKSTNHPGLIQILENINNLYKKTESFFTKKIKQKKFKNITTKYKQKKVKNLFNNNTKKKEVQKIFKNLSTKYKHQRTKNKIKEIGKIQIQKKKEKEKKKELKEQKDKEKKRALAKKIGEKKKLEKEKKMKQQQERKESERIKRNERIKLLQKQKEEEKIRQMEIQKEAEIKKAEKIRQMEIEKKKKANTQSEIKEDNNKNSQKKSTNNVEVFYGKEPNNFMEEMSNGERNEFNNWMAELSNELSNEERKEPNNWLAVMSNSESNTKKYNIQEENREKILSEVKNLKNFINIFNLKDDKLVKILFNCLISQKVLFNNINTILEFDLRNIKSDKEPGIIRYITWLLDKCKVDMRTKIEINTSIYKYLQSQKKEYLKIEKFIKSLNLSENITDELINNLFEDGIKYDSLIEDDIEKFIISYYYSKSFNNEKIDRLKKELKQIKRNNFERKAQNTINVGAVSENEFNQLKKITNKNSSFNRMCDFCGKELINILKCSRCKLVYYCSNNCQRKDWKKKHKEECDILINKKNKEFIKFMIKHGIKINDKKEKEYMLLFEELKSIQISDENKAKIIIVIYNKNISLELIKMVKSLLEKYEGGNGFIYNKIISISIPILEILEKYKFDTEDIVQLLYTFFVDSFIETINVLPQLPLSLHASYICNTFIEWLRKNNPRINPDSNNLVKNLIDMNLIRIIFDKISLYYKDNLKIDSMPLTIY